MAPLIHTLRRWTKRGDWVPLIPIAYRWPILMLLALAPLVVGVDYLMGESTQGLSEVERSAPLWLWGTIGVIAGLLVTGGYAMRWPTVCIAGLWSSGAMFSTISVGVGWALIDGQGGFRGSFLYGAIAVASFFAAMGYMVQMGDRA